MTNKGLTPDRIPVLLVVRALPAHRPGGLEFHTLDLANGLADVGHPVTILTTELTPQSASWNIHGGLRPAIHVETTPTIKQGRYGRPFWRSVAELSAAWSRKQFLEFGGKDQPVLFPVVHAQEYAGLLIPRRPGGAVLVHTIHGTVTSEVTLDSRYMAHLPPWGWIRELWRHRGRLAMTIPFMQMLRRADLLITDSDFTRERILRRHPGLRTPVESVACGLDFQRLGPPGIGAPIPLEFRTDSPLRLAMLQRIQLQKGVAVALTSIGKLVQEGLPTELDVAGQGDFLEQARQLSRQLGLERVVRFHGRIPDSDIGPFLSRCHAMLIPDLAQPAFGLVAIEAMHYGLPVIAARSGALPENVHPHCGWVYDDPFDPESLGNLLRQILSHPASLLSRVEHLHSHANRHTASNMARRVSLLYLAMANLDPTGRMERPLQDKAADIP